MSIMEEMNTGQLGTMGCFVKPVWIPFCCTLSYTSAISAILGTISGEFRISTTYNPLDGEFDISPLDQACCVCTCPSCVPGGVCLLSVLQLCTLFTHEGGQVMYVAMPYFVFMDAVVSCLIQSESISYVWNPCGLFHFTVLWASVSMGHVCPSFGRNPMKALCCI